MKNSLVLCLLLAGCCAMVDCRPKRSVIYTAPLVASVGVPIVHTASVVHSHPTSVVKTEQVQSHNGASYSYSSEVRSAPVVHTHQVAAVAHHPAVATVTHHTVPTYAAYGYYPAASYYSPYHYVVGK